MIILEIYISLASDVKHGIQVNNIKTKCKFLRIESKEEFLRPCNTMQFKK